ncbi:MAG: sugar phosphate isomerase/epimerase family protein [Phycisphaerales bacterium]
MRSHQMGLMGAGIIASALALQPSATRPGSPGQPGKDAPAHPAPEKPARNDSASEALGLRLGVQAWTFRDRTAHEAIAAARDLNIKYMQCYPGQPLSPESPEVKVGADMTAPQRASLRRMLDDAGVRAVSFGVVGFSKDQAAARRTFQFAKDMGFETIAAEPDPDAWDLVEALADEFDIRVACHDHPKPSRYWDPVVVLDAIKGRSKRLGFCADTGHWKRSGLDPVKCLEQAGGKVFELHFKDISAGVDKPWGTGECGAEAMLRTLRAQGFKGCIFVEYEDGKGIELEANVAKCVEFFDKTAEAIRESEKKK